MTARGVSLLEVMTAVALTAIIMVGLLEALQLTLRRQAAQTELLALSESQQLLERVARWVAQAGEGSVHPLGLDDDKLQLHRARVSGAVLDQATDVLLLQHVVGQPVGHDCEGAGYVAGTRSVQRLFVRKDSATSSWALVCDAGYCNDTSCTRLGDAGIVLLGGIKAFQLSYGVQGADGYVVYHAGDTDLHANATLLSVRLRLALAEHVDVLSTWAIEHHDEPVGR